MPPEEPGALFRDYGAVSVTLVTVTPGGVRVDYSDLIFAMSEPLPAEPRGFRAAVLAAGVKPALSEHERAGVAARTSDKVLLAELGRGVGLGEWLIAGPQLMEKLANGQQPSRAFVDTVVAWYRTGLDEPLAEADAQRLWVETMPEVIRHRFAELAPEQQDARFRAAVDWATASVVGRDLYEQALVSRRGGGYVAHDYVVDRVARDPNRQPVPDAIWREALDIAGRDAASGSRAVRIWRIGTAANQENAFESALAAMRVVAAEGDPVASYNVGATLGKMARHSEALTAFEDVVGRLGDPPDPALRETVAKALFNRGVALGHLDRPEEELAAYQDLISRYADAPEPALRKQVAKALLNRGVTLGQLDRPEEELAAYQDLISRYADAPEPALREHVAKALLYQGVPLGQLDRPEEALVRFTEVETRFAADTEPVICHVVERARTLKALIESVRPSEG